MMLKFSITPFFLTYWHTPIILHLYQIEKIISPNSYRIRHHSSGQAHGFDVAVTMGL